MMKISEIISTLEMAKSLYGDLDCLVSFKNQLGDYISDKKIVRIYHDSYAIDPDVASIGKEAIVFKINGVF